MLRPGDRMGVTLEDLIGGGQIVAADATDLEVARWWEKARTFRRGSESFEDDTGAFLLGYQSAFQIATAVVRAGGYRAQGHALHHNTFAGAGALLGDRAGRALRVLDRLGSVYGAIDRGEPNVTTGDLEQLRNAVAVVFEECRNFIGGVRPEVLQPGLLEMGTNA
jgi:hypothetical protein